LCAKKYGNRALLLTVLEAGHVAQNMLLAATESKLAAIEVGGFLEAQLAKTLYLDKSTPLISVIFGKAEEGAPAPLAKPSVQFNWIDMNGTDFTLPFHVGEARFRDAQGDEASGWGRDSDASMAYSKAMAEALERISCEEPKRLFKARFVDVPDAIEPQKITAYTPIQYASSEFPFKRFKQDQSYWWGTGEEYGNGRKVSILADFLFSHSGLRALKQTAAYTFSTTSGVAAHTEPDQAIQSAALELVERDAFMYVWLTRDQTPTIPLRSLPAVIKNRIKTLNRLGVEVVAKDISKNFAPVILFFAQSHRYGFTRVATSSCLDAEMALEHALSELELFVQEAILIGTAVSAVPNDVVMPEDHAQLYSSRKYYRRADFLAKATTTRSFSSIGKKLPRDWERFLGGLDRAGKKLFLVDITSDDKNLVFMAHMNERRPMRVVRAVIPGLIPISFGYGREPLGMLAHGSKSTYRGATPMFPHPFA
jgi:ribosomal protein S12 methylthiotransferase accessory factor